MANSQNITLTLSLTPLSNEECSRTLKILWYWAGTSGFSLNAPPVAVEDDDENALRNTGSSNFTIKSSPSPKFD